MQLEMNVMALRRPEILTKDLKQKHSRCQPNPGIDQVQPPSMSWAQTLKQLGVISGSCQLAWLGFMAIHLTFRWHGSFIPFPAAPWEPAQKNGRGS